MPETRFTSFPALSVNSRVGISLSASEANDWLFFLPIIGKNVVFYDNISMISFNVLLLMLYNG